jgi:hypothetical protein
MNTVMFMALVAAVGLAWLLFTEEEPFDYERDYDDHDYEDSHVDVRSEEIQ